MSGLFIFIGVVVGVPLLLWQVIAYEWRQAEKKEKLELLQLELKLLEEKEKPMTRIVFELNNGERKQFELIEPIIEGGKVISSYVFAKIMLDTCFEVGYFRDEAMVKYPTCNVAKAWLEKDK